MDEWWKKFLYITVEGIFLSLIHIYNTDVYYTFDEPEFSDIVKENLKIFLQRINIECDTSDFSIVPLKGKKVVTRTMGQFVDGNIGIYKITGNLRLLEILYAAGIGTRRSAGHGKFEIIF